jgi:hypothetical protein
MGSAQERAQDAEKDEHAGRPYPEREAHGATPPHGDPLTREHAETAGPHEHGEPEPEDDSAAGPHGDPLAG